MNSYIVNQVFIEDTPNPDVLMFKPFGFSLDIDFVISIPFDGIDSDFFNLLVSKFEFVKALYIHNNGIGIAKKSSEEWSEVNKSAIIEEIVSLLNNQVSLYNNEAPSKKIWAEGTVESKISLILEERVRPAVAADGGDVELHAFKDGIAYIDLRGACVGCPSSTATLRVAIKRILSHFVDEVEDVDTPDNMI